MSLLPRWTSRVFSVDLDGASLYFAIQKQQQHRRHEASPRVFSALQNHDRCYSLLVCSSDRIKSAKFYCQLKDKLLRDLPPECHLSPMSSFLPNVRDSLVKGYFLKGNPDSSPPIERLLTDLIQHDPVLVCSYFQSEDGQQWTQHLWSQTGSQMKEMEEKYDVVTSEAPGYHPATLNIINSDVFYSFEEARDVLRTVCMHSFCRW